MYSDLSPPLKIRTKREMWERMMQWASMAFFRVRRSSFSLKIRAIRPSAVFETRRRTALRREGFAWVPDLWSFLKLQEVGVSPYMGFIPSFKYFTNV